MENSGCEAWVSNWQEQFAIAKFYTTEINNNLKAQELEMQSKLTRPVDKIFQHTVNWSK